MAPAPFALHAGLSAAAGGVAPDHGCLTLPHAPEDPAVTEADYAGEPECQPSFAGPDPVPGAVTDDEDLEPDPDHRTDKALAEERMAALSAYPICQSFACYGTVRRQRVFEGRDRGQAAIFRDAARRGTFT